MSFRLLHTSAEAELTFVYSGDPGLGKSQLLQAAAAVSPRGIYVCGNATTNAGLTVAVVKDRMTSDYAFEAGTDSSLSLSFTGALMSISSCQFLTETCIVCIYFLISQLGLFGEAFQKQFCFSELVLQKVFLENM